MRVATLLVALFSVGAANAAAQSSLVVPVVTQLPASTRAHALGNAYPYASAESDVIFYNPGLLNSARGFAGSAAQYGTNGRLVTGSAAGDWLGGGLAFGLRALTWNVPADPLVDTRAEDAVWAGGAGSASEIAATLAYARTVFGFRAGVAGSVVEQRTAGARETTPALDVGIARALGPATVALAARNVGPDPSVADGSPLNGPRSMSVTLGGATGSRAVGPLDVMLAASGTWTRGDHIDAGGGVEVAYWPVTGRTFFLRVGFRHLDASDLAPLTLGAGFSGDRISLDASVQDTDANADPLYRLTIRLR